MGLSMLGVITAKNKQQYEDQDAVADHEDGNWPRPVTTYDSSTVEEYVRSLLDNPELIDRLALASEQDVVESRVIFPKHLPLSQLQQGVRSGRFVQGTFLASRENYLEGTLRVRGDGDSDKEVHVSQACFWKEQCCSIVSVSFKNKFTMKQWHSVLGMSSSS
uniref:Exosome complex exonuclease RRP44-like n=1 Tax=Petromyzon marinus TaxID=7757 RepID=A0AAJ7WKT4_PETMA|nr:exosome complex exonuclease RRP44-like [Petromyzon marinus]